LVARRQARVRASIPNSRAAFAPTGTNISGGALDIVRAHRGETGGGKGPPAALADKGEFAH
jgi:hypothetical protein